MSQLIVVGAGMLGSHHLTLESVEALKNADVVYHLVNGADAIDVLIRLNPRTHSLVSFYREGELDLHVYGRIASFLIAQATVHRAVAFVVMGHPAIYVAPTHLLVEHGPRHGVNVRVLPALSTIDVILASMPFDIANTGLQVLDANRLVTYGLSPNTCIPMLLFQVGCFGSGFITRTTENSPRRLAPLVDYLLKHYPADHSVQLIECEMGTPHRETRRSTSLVQLAELGHLINYNTTVFVPPSAPLRVQDQEFQHKLVDPEAVSALVVGH